LRPFSRARRDAETCGSFINSQRQSERQILGSSPHHRCPGVDRASRSQPPAMPRFLSIPRMIP